MKDRPLARPCWPRWEPAPFARFPKPATPPSGPWNRPRSTPRSKRSTTSPTWSTRNSIAISANRSGRSASWWRTPGEGRDIRGHPRCPGTKEWVAPSASPTDWLQLVNQLQTEAGQIWWPPPFAFLSLFSFLGEWRRLYDDGKEAAMIELTDQQVQALENPEGTPPQLVNPRTKETFVLLRVDEYKRLTEDYDDSPWTREELEALAWESGK